MRNMWNSKLIRTQRGGVQLRSNWLGLHIAFRVTAIFAVAFLVTLIAASALAPVTSSSAAETKLTANVTFATHTITITAAPSVDLDIHARPEGAMTVAASTVNLSTTSPNGYRLYLGMNSDTSDLLISGTDYSTRLKASSGTFTNPATMENEDSTWGYAISSTAATVAKPNGFDANYTTGEDLSVTTNKFASIPSNENPPQLIAKSDNASASGGDSLSVYYAVRASYDTTPGAYSNQVVYSAISDGGSGHDMVVNPSQTSNIAGGDELDVITSLYGTVGSIEGKVYMLTVTERDAVHNGTPVTNYSTKAMSCTRDASSDTLKYSCIAPSNPIGSYYVYVDVPEYAEHYEKAFNYVQATFWNISTMQQMTPALCASATTPDASARIVDTTGAFAGNTSYVPQRTLYDIRDRETYTIRKLADGNCWMTENLRKELAQGEVLTPATSDVTSNITVGATTQPYDQPSANYYDWGVGTGGTQTEANTDRWLSRSTKKDGVWTTETTPIQDVSDSRKQDLTGEDQKTGVYYNWYAATAGTGTWSIATAGIEASSSVCPAGWQLPRYSDSSSWMYLIRDTYKIITTQGDQGTGSTANAQLHAFPFSLPYSGSVDWQAGGTGNQGAAGLFWSAGSTSQTTARYSIFNGTNVSPERSSSRLNGFSVRCIASNQDFWSISTMQEMTPEIVSSVVTPSTTAASAVTNATDYANTYDKTSVVPERVLTDARDGETYRVRKLADGNVWMTENLRLTLTEGQAIEISDGSMWLPTNYDGTTTNSTTLTVADQDSKKWYNADPSVAGTDIVRSYNTAGSEGVYKCFTGWGQSSGSGLQPFGTQECHETAQTYDGEIQKYGVYYNWYTATAGEGTVARNTQTTISICPKGWALPSADSYVQLLKTTYKRNSLNEIMSFPISFIKSGAYQTDWGSAVLSEGGGLVITSTPQITNQSTGASMNVYNLQIGGTSYVLPGNQRKRNGHIIRCAVSGL